MKNLQAPTFLLFLCGVLFFVLFYSCIRPDAIVKDPIGSPVKCDLGEIRNIDGNNYVCTRVTITDGQCRAKYGCTEWKKTCTKEGGCSFTCVSEGWDCDCGYTLQCQPENEKCNSTIFNEELPTCPCIDYLRPIGFTKGGAVYNGGVCPVEKKSFYALIRQQ